MTKKLFEIEEYYLSPKVINVVLQDEREIVINRREFEQWLEDRGRLEFIYVMPDHTGEPKEIEGIMSVKSYWGEWDAYGDLYDYIIINNMVDPFDVNEPLKNILNDYSQE